MISYLRCDTDHEYVRIANLGGLETNLLGWRLVSVVGPQTFYFPSYTLGAGLSVTVSSGPSAPPTGGSNIRWTTNNIWNNSGDEAELWTPGSVLVDHQAC